MLFKKRFTIGHVLTKCSGLRDNGKLMTFSEVVDLLNKQHKQIQSYRIEYGQLLLDFEELKQENKQLKKELDTFKPVIFQDMRKGSVILYSKEEVKE